MIFKVVDYNLLNKHHALSLSSDVGLNFALVHASLQPLAPADLLQLGDSQLPRWRGAFCTHPQGRIMTNSHQASGTDCTAGPDFQLHLAHR